MDLKDETLKVLRSNAPSSISPKYSLEINAPAILHTIPGRMGPLVSNDVIVAIGEKLRNPDLKRIVAIQQPFGSSAKHLFYWLSGLPNEVIFSTLKNMRDEGIIFAESFDKYFANITANASMLRMPIDVFVKVFIRPYAKHLKEIHILENEFELDDQVFGHTDYEDVSLEEGLLLYSQALMNHIMKKHSLPCFEVRREDVLVRSMFPLRFISGQKLKLQSHVAKMHDRYGDLDPAKFLKDLDSTIKGMARAVMSGDLKESPNHAMGDVTYCDGRTITIFTYYMSQCYRLPLVIQEQPRTDIYPLYDGIADIDLTRIDLETFRTNTPGHATDSPVQHFQSAVSLLGEKQFPEYDSNIATAVHYL